MKRVFAGTNRHLRSEGVSGARASGWSLSQLAVGTWSTPAKAAANDALVRYGMYPTVSNEMVLDPSGRVMVGLTHGSQTKRYPSFWHR